MQYAYLFNLLVLIVGPLVKLVFRIIGFGFVTYTGINFIIDQAKNYIIAEVGGAGSTVINILGLMKFDIAVNIMLAAVTTRFLLAGFDKATGTRRTTVWNKPGTGGTLDA